NAEARALLEKIDAGRSLSYYDARAAQLLDRALLRDLPRGPAASGTPDARVSRALERWSLLRDIGWNESASYELARLKRDVGSNIALLYTIAEQLIAKGHANAGIHTGRELLEKGERFNHRLLRILYPLPYQDTIEREARRHGLDPFFVAALMRQESWFNPQAVSGANAVGLMQVVPSTGRALARGENVGNVTAETLKDPEINIRLGTKFLADLMRTWQSRTDAVLAAYNAGPTRMERWRRFPEFAQPDLFVERIPFEETRDYVRVVRVNTTIYHALYGD
ncbi:MAG TPA: lytic transglycosylase domain-containing protein, partial [Longimicrobiales bacterium]